MPLQPPVSISSCSCSITYCNALLEVVWTVSCIVFSFAEILRARELLFVFCFVLFCFVLFCFVLFCIAFVYRQEEEWAWPDSLRNQTDGWHGIIAMYSDSRLHIFQHCIRSTWDMFQLHIRVYVRLCVVLQTTVRNVHALWTHANPQSNLRVESVDRYSRSLTAWLAAMHTWSNYVLKGRHCPV